MTSLFKIGFYGMTHLGLVSAVAAASKQFQVIGFDPDEALIERLKQHDFHIQEPELLQLAKLHANQLTFTASLQHLLEADLIYLSIDVPTNIQNESDHQPICNALEHLRNHLKSSQIIVVLSQVSPGFTRSMRFPSGQLFYQVETLIFGRAIERATQPERFIVGCADEKRILPQIYREFLEIFQCPILTMRYESAELAKIAINMYLVSSVITSNMLAELAASVGADWEEIIPTLRLDKRIGPHAYLSPGLGISGGNLERDMLTVLQQAEQQGSHAELIKVWRAESQYYKNWVWRCLSPLIAQRDYPTIALLGLAYKANTHSIKNSPAIELIAQLHQRGACIQAHDPAIEKKSVLHVKHCDSVLQALQSAEVLVIMTPWVEYKNLSASMLLTTMRGRAVIDPYRVLQHEKLMEAGFSVFTLGIYYQELVHA